MIAVVRAKERGRRVVFERVVTLQNSIHPVRRTPSGGPTMVDDIQAIENLPEPGQLVMVRQRHFVVLDVKKSTLPSEGVRPGDQTAQHAVSLSSVEDDALGEELRVVWELEPGARAYERASLPQPTNFDDPAQM